MHEADPGDRRRHWVWGILLVGLAAAARLGWVLAVPTVPVSDFAMYRESANWLSEFRCLDRGFIYMPGFVVLLAWVKDLGGDLLAQKMIGVAFGTLGAAALYVLTLRTLCLGAAVIATALYALWPAGVAMASVVGTDVPAAALIASALAVLVALGPRRPWAAAIAFGAVMGVAAWMRAVALPLSVLGAGYWVARRERWPRAAALTAAGVAATLLVLLPWGVRHLRRTGDFYLTDDHGGITALIGANPNSEGTYTRALNRMFQDVTGRAVLDEPHREVDKIAYAMARQWMRFEPSYAAGLAAMKAERLFDPEQRLLYWSVFRPGVLVGAAAAWFEARRQGIGAAVDAFGWAVAALALAGIAIALARRRWEVVALVPFQLALAATYTFFFAEPRYRLPIELLAFPFVALALIEIAATGAALGRRDWARARTGARRLGAAVAVIVAWRLAWPAVVVDGGAALRARHRWAVTEWRVGDRPRPCLWRPAGVLPAVSPLEGAPEGVRVRAPAAAAVELGGAPLPPGAYAIHLALEAAGAPVRVQLVARGGTVADVTARPTVATALDGTVHHAGGPLQLSATVSADSAGAASVWISEGSIQQETP